MIKIFWPLPSDSHFCRQNSEMANGLDFQKIAMLGLEGQLKVMSAALHVVVVVVVAGFILAPMVP